MKNIPIQETTHTEVKILCATKNIKIQDFVNDALKKAVKNEQRKLDKAS